MACEHQILGLASVMCVSEILPMSRNASGGTSVLARASRAMSWLSHIPWYQLVLFTSSYIWRIPNMGRGVAISRLSQFQRQITMPMCATVGIRPQSVVTAAVTIKRTFVFSNTVANAYLPSIIPRVAVAGIRLLSTPRIVGPPPQLFDLIIQLRFDEALKRVKSHPHEVSYPHPRRWTALHACVEYGAPIEVVEALLEAYPDALVMKDWRGQTPLDVALTDELKLYLASVDVSSLFGSETGGRDVEGGIPTDNLAADVTPENPHGVLQHIDKMSQQVANLRRQCDSLEDEIRNLRKALDLTKRRG